MASCKVIILIRFQLAEISSEEEMDSDTTIPYPIEEDGVPPTETPLAGALAPEDRPPASKRRKRRRKRKKGVAGHRRPKEEGLCLLPLRHHLLLVGAGTIGK